MSERQNQIRLDLLAFRYLEAVEAGDMNTLDSLWDQADGDAELEQVLHGLNEALATDREEQERIEGAITAALEQHIPSAAILRTPAGLLTVADVAESIRRNPPAGLTTDEITANEQLRQSGRVLPSDLGMSQVLEWGREFGSLPETYWRAFRKAALKLRMQRESNATYQMAARKPSIIDRRSRRDGDDQSKESCSRSRVSACPISHRHRPNAPRPRSTFATAGRAQPALLDVAPLDPCVDRGTLAHRRHCSWQSAGLR